MSDSHIIEGVAATLPINNLDTDQIMPKQFLRGIDKQGLSQGVFHDLRFNPDGSRRDGFILNEPDYNDCRILIGGANFGCGSSREHAVWGLTQLGIRAIIAPSFGEIFYSNAMNNRLLLAVVSQEELDRISADVAASVDHWMRVDVRVLTLQTRLHRTTFPLSPRHQQMFLNDWDMVAASLGWKSKIEAFERQHWDRQPWLKSVAAKARKQYSSDP